jgi:hypothetical protein
MLYGIGSHNVRTEALITAQVAIAPTAARNRRQTEYKAGRKNRLYTPQYERPSRMMPDLIDFAPELVDAADRVGPEVMENGYLVPIQDSFFTYNHVEATANLADRITQVLTFDRVTFVTIPANLIYPNLVGDKPIRRLCRGTIQLEEPLLTVGGASTFVPSHIFSRLDELPPIIQDFRFQVESTREWIKKQDCMSVDGAIGIFKPQLNTNFKLGTYSKNTFRQQEKSLQTVDEKLVDVMLFTGTFDRSASGRYEVPFATLRGQPQYVFIRVERKGGLFDAFSKYPVQLKGLGIVSVDQDIKSVSCLDEYRVRRATVSNSNLRADAEQNRKDIGGILLSMDDFCKWTDFDFYTPQDVLEGAFVVTEEQIRDWPESVGTTIDARTQTLIKDQPIEIRISFVYSDYRVKGESGTMKFEYPPFRMEKLLLQSF